MKLYGILLLAAVSASCALKKEDSSLLEVKDGATYDPKKSYGINTRRVTKEDTCKVENAAKPFSHNQDKIKERLSILKQWYAESNKNFVAGLKPVQVLIAKSKQQAAKNTHLFYQEVLKVYKTQGSYLERTYQVTSEFLQKTYPEKLKGFELSRGKELSTKIATATDAEVRTLLANKLIEECRRIIQVPVNNQRTLPEQRSESSYVSGVTFYLTDNSEEFLDVDSYYGRVNRRQVEAKGFVDFPRMRVTADKKATKEGWIRIFGFFEVASSSIYETDLFKEYDLIKVFLDGFDGSGPLELHLNYGISRTFMAPTRQGNRINIPVNSRTGIRSVERSLDGPNDTYTTDEIGKRHKRRYDSEILELIRKEAGIPAPSKN